MPIKNLYLKIKYFFYNNYKKNKNRIILEKEELRLNLGCGFDYKSGWINIDSNPNCIVDIKCDFFNLDKFFKEKSVSHIVLNHSISYLSLWQARDFFSKVFKLLKNGGVLEMEFPDVVKCATIICNQNVNDEYIEAIRGLYAFDLDQINNKEKYTPYAFGWSSKHIVIELQKNGFQRVEVLDPITHGPRVWRDTRIIAFKNL
jgi:hypothetical protein